MSPTHVAELVLLDPDDDVGVAARDLSAGEVISAGSAGRVRLAESVPMGHKVALRSLERGQTVRKYGYPIGLASESIGVGVWVHSHNLEDAGSRRVVEARKRQDAASTVPASEGFAEGGVPTLRTPPPPDLLEGHTFQGYRRASGRFGTRNYVAVISTVNCSASVSRYVARRFAQDALRNYPHVDGVIAITHHSGCGMPYGGLAHAMLDRVLGGLIHHPNVGGCLLIGLGCEQATSDHLFESLRVVPISGVASCEQPIPVLSIQDLGGTTRTVESAVAEVARLLPRVDAARREAAPARGLILGLECGGSDGSSGITANPALGVAADLLIAAGGTAILSETPEIYGAEQLLARRAVSVEVAQKLLDRIRWWQGYTAQFGCRLDNNPSVGNKAGGITTIAEKSLGAIAKGGSTALVDVYQYAERVQAAGLVVMDTPGYDPASVTGMVAGGANIVVFTTGRGSCFGCKPTPSLKVASNTPMYQRMIDDMDIDAGTVLQGRSLSALGGEIFAEILAVASGKRTKSEVQGMGDEEFLPWIVGPML